MNKETKGTIVKLIELGIANGLIKKGRKEAFADGLLDRLLTCIDVTYSFYDEKGIEAEELCEFLLVGNGTFADIKSAETESETFLNGVQFGRNYGTMELKDINDFSTTHYNLDFKDLE